MFVTFARPIYSEGKMSTQSTKQSWIYSSRDHRPDAGNAAGSDACGQTRGLLDVWLMQLPSLSELISSERTAVSTRVRF
jgi:hypothetical protein